MNHLLIVNDVPHELHGIVPRCKLPLLPCIQSPLPNEIEDLACNLVIFDQMATDSRSSQE